MAEGKRTDGRSPVFAAAEYRGALRDLPNVAAWENLEPPQLSEISVPPTHNKALSPETTIVEGMRGAGKSFWTAVLANDTTRAFVAAEARLATNQPLVVRVGFGLDLSNNDFPSPQFMAALVDSPQPPDAIWRAVLLRHALKLLEKDLPFDDNWQSAVGWVAAQPAKVAETLATVDRELAAQGRTLLLLFDALDRLGDDWSRIRDLLTAALKLGLECRSRRALRCKFFLRPDMVEEEDEVWRFADSAKLLHPKATLDWSADDLYRLVVQHLANSPAAGAAFRATLAQHCGVRWSEAHGAYPLPRDLPAEALRWVIEDLAGPWVGRSATRGFTWTWIPTHLADAKRRLSPRSILLAFREAAEWTEQHQRSDPRALHFQGVQQGVVKASAIRVRELQEDYPWVEPLLRALSRSTVPLSFDELAQHWTPVCISESLAAAASKQRLPPRRYSSAGGRNLAALLEDLVELAVLYPTEDRKRYNMPDIFRVGFGIKRKGGVRPLR
ncbi:hypothetical protein [Accumulibacter sp.]|uniref:hypothetical protein n=1 Tax=Accumulibacter sp. TaxID=2053492 RepID=UPI0025D7FC1C|nr:hypothetical protein [Accumulibacter sp.]MCM8614179.1 hypothetical protein [Accumulibacter sp.]MCM8637946.1 hypothetical protein [Accumulibacter sp.]MCM8641415.1 hypothetical protein [Accumulibacter sp.]